MGKKRQSVTVLERETTKGTNIFIFIIVRLRCHSVSLVEKDECINQINKQTTKFLSPEKLSILGGGIRVLNFIEIGVKNL